MLNNFFHRFCLHFSPVAFGELLGALWNGLRAYWFLNYPVAGATAATRALYGDDFLWATVTTILCAVQLFAVASRFYEMRLVAAVLTALECFYWTSVYIKSSHTTIGVPTMVCFSAFFFYTLVSMKR